VEMGPKGGRSGPSTQRRLAAEGQLVVAAGTGGRGAAPELRDGSGRSGRGWRGLSVVAQ
jgi:hypothetical protein